MMGPGEEYNGVNLYRGRGGGGLYRIEEHTAAFQRVSAILRMNFVIYKSLKLCLQRKVPLEVELCGVLKIRPGSIILVSNA